MYEHLRNDLITKLSTTFNNSDINIICGALDTVVMDYDIIEKTTSLVVYEDRFPRLCEIYLQSKKLEGLSHNSLKLYRGRLRIFFELMQMRPEEVTTNDIRCFLVTYQKQTGVSDRTLDKFRQVINGFYTWCVDEEYLVKNPCRNIKEIKFEVTPRTALTRMELEILRRACRSKRELAIVDTLYSTGCRVSELVNMKMSDIKAEDASVHTVGKGRKHNDTYFNINAQLSLADYINEKGHNTEYVFTQTRWPYDRLSAGSVEQMFRELSDIINIKVTPHTMRHTFATLALQSGMSINEVQRFLNHASINTTLIYAEMSQNDLRNSHIKHVI